MLGQHRYDPCTVAKREIRETIEYGVGLQRLGAAVNADAIVLCKTMKVTYQLSDQVFTTNQSDPDMSLDNLADFSRNMIDDANILVKYEVGLRTKILKAEGARHANIDITYYHLNDPKFYSADEVTDLKVKVFSKNEKGKVVKRNVNTDGFVRERVDDNYMVIHVDVPDVQEGSIVEYQYNITSVRPTFLYDWVFQECIPTVRSKCDIDIPAFLQFQMNAPIHKLIKSSVQAGRLAYDTNRPDLKRESHVSRTIMSLWATIFFRKTSRLLSLPVRLPCLMSLYQRPYPRGVRI